MNGIMVHRSNRREFIRDLGIGSLQPIAIRPELAKPGFAGQQREAWLVVMFSPNGVGLLRRSGPMRKVRRSKLKVMQKPLEPFRDRC